MLSGPIEHCVARAKSLGYDAIEFSVGDPDLVDADSLQEALRRHDMKIAAINSGGLHYLLGLSLVNADPGIEQRAFQKLQSIIRLAAQLGCPTQVGVSRGFALAKRSLREFRERLVDALRRACDLAGSLGSTLVLEYTNRFEINTINTGRQAREMILEVDRPNLGLLLDTHHAWVEDDDVCEEILQSASLLKHVHLHDSDYRSPGISQGELDFDQVFGALAAVNYSGFLSDGLFAGALNDSEIRASTTFLQNLLGRHALHGDPPRISSE